MEPTNLAFEMLQLLIFHQFSQNAVKSAELTAVSVLMTYIVRDKTWRSLIGLTKNVVLFHCLMTKFNLIYMKNYLPTIICVIQGSSQMGSENNLSLSVDYRSYFSKLRFHGPEVEGHDFGTPLPRLMRCWFCTVSRLMCEVLAPFF